MWKCTGCNSINDEHDRFCGCCGRIRPEASRTIHLAATDTDRESTTLSKGIKEPVTQELENLKSYLHPGVGFLYVSAGLLIFGIIGASSAGIAVFIFMLIIAILNSITTIDALNRYKQCFEQIEANGKTAEVIADFAGAQNFFDDQLKLGDRYIYGRKSGRILSYYDIKNVYQHIHKTNFVEDRRGLYVKTTSDETISICKMKTRGKSDAELMRVVTEMLRRNSHITVGYKG